MAEGIRWLTGKGVRDTCCAAARILVVRTARPRSHAQALSTPLVFAQQPRREPCCSRGSSQLARWMSIGKNEWPRDWIRREERWHDMDPETQGLWRTLGWSEQLWAAHFTKKRSGQGVWTPRCPPIQRKKWAALRDAEREAAQQLGYCEKLWEFEDKQSARKSCAPSPLPPSPFPRPSSLFEEYDARSLNPSSLTQGRLSFARLSTPGERCTNSHGTKSRVDGAVDLQANLLGARSSTRGASRM